MKIADKYDLKLSKSQTAFGNKEGFETLTDVGMFTELDCNNFSCYIFEDGSFKPDFEIIIDRPYPCSLSRICSGSIYPYGGVSVAQPMEEEEYRTENNQSLSICLAARARTISHVSPDGKTFIELNFTAYTFGNANAAECLKLIADNIDFDALCHKSALEVSFTAQHRTGLIIRSQLMS